MVMKPILEMVEENFLEQLVHFGLDFAQRVDDMKPVAPVSRVRIRVGIASGPLATGVVGMTMPHYSVFGDTVNMAARMEQNSVAGKVLFCGSKVDVQNLEAEFHLEKRESVFIKGKEGQEIDSFFVTRRMGASRTTSSQTLGWIGHKEQLSHPELLSRRKRSDPAPTLFHSFMEDWREFWATHKVN